MSLSKTELANDDESLSELITSDISHEGGKSQRRREREREVSTDIGLDPVDEELFREREQMEESRNLGQEFETLVIDRANEMYYRLGTHMSESTLEGLMAGVSAIVNLDKSRWISFRGEVSDG
jgi:hypothetical protein